MPDRRRGKRGAMCVRPSGEGTGVRIHVFGGPPRRQAFDSSGPAAEKTTPHSPAAGRGRPTPESGGSRRWFPGSKKGRVGGSASERPRRRSSSSKRRRCAQEGLAADSIRRGEAQGRLRRGRFALPRLTACRRPAFLEPRTRFCPACAAVVALPGSRRKSSITGVVCGRMQAGGRRSRIFVKRGCAPPEGRRLGPWGGVSQEVAGGPGAPGHIVAA